MASYTVKLKYPSSRVASDRPVSERPPRILATTMCILATRTEQPPHILATASKQSDRTVSEQPPRNRATAQYPGNCAVS